MRSAAALAILAIFFAAACASTASGTEPMSEPTIPHRVLRSGSAGHPAPAASIVVASTDAEYRAAWSSSVGEGNPPPVDFPRERVLFLLLGTRNTGGYAVAVQSVVRDGDTLLVHAPVQRPPAGGMTTQALTAPWAAVAVDVPAFRAVRWLDAGGRELAAAP
jgi:hypothetical protein